MKKAAVFLIVLVTVFMFASCAVGDSAERHDIVILFTNDIHSGIREGITLAGVAEYKKRIEAVTPYVALVDCGDAIEGSYLGTVSKGEVVVDAMNEVGYTYCIFGNHEFAYGIPRLNELTSKARAKYLCCNITYSGTEENELKNYVPYDIVRYGGSKVAFIGVSTPMTLTTANPKVFMENDKRVYDFAGGNDGQNLCDAVQKTVNDALADGADYIICLSHLGISKEDAPYFSTMLANGTEGIDVILDGHSHSQFEYFNTVNKNGEPVVVAQTGTQLASLGQLVITSDGLITVSLVSDITEKDEEIDAKINALVEKYGELLEKAVFNNTFGLSIRDENGVRTVRNTETAIGNLCSDAFRIIGNADIAYVNGGSVRDSLPEGEVKVSDIIALMPFANTAYNVRVTGSEIADMLEYWTKEALPETVDYENNQPIGEFGSFPQMSGIKFTLDTTLPPCNITLTEEGDLISVDDGQRRVSDIMILENGEYVPIDMNKTYTMATSDYVAVNGGSGMLLFLADHETESVGILDYDCLIRYITENISADLSRYAQPEGRISFIR